MTLGQKIKELRVRNAYTLENLANLSGLSIVTICVVENDKRVPSLSTLRKLADALDVDVKELTALLK